MKRTYLTLSAVTVLGLAAVACSVNDLGEEKRTTAKSPLTKEKPQAEISAPQPAVIAEQGADIAEVLARTSDRKASTALSRNDLAALQVQRGVGPLAADQYLPPYPSFLENRDRYEGVSSNPLKLVSDEPVSTFSIDVDTASYANIRRYLKDGVLPPVDAVRIEELINYFDYAYAVPEKQDQPFAADVALFETPWDAGTQLMRIGIKGYEISASDRPPANLVFLVDTSGSMNSQDKLPLLQRSLRLLVEEMRAEDRIAIVAYAGHAGVVLEPTRGDERAKIIRAIEDFQAGGSTAGADGIVKAYQLAEANFDDAAVNRVILATDGDFNVGMSDPDRLEDFISLKRKSGVYLSILGFGRGNLNDYLMQKIAQCGNGNAHYIDGLMEAQKVLVEEMGSTLFPIADDVKIQVEFNPDRVAEYRLIGYETRMLRREDFNNDQIDAGEIGSGHTVTALYEITPPKSPSRLIDRLRYGVRPASLDRPADMVPAGTVGEVAWLRFRFKQPGEEKSRLIEQPVSADAATTFDEAASDARFASAVAAFGQILRQSAYVGPLDLDAVEDMARSARGDDAFGYRAEFLQLVRMAKSADALQSSKKRADVFQPGRNRADAFQSSKKSADALQSGKR